MSKKQIRKEMFMGFAHKLVIGLSFVTQMLGTAQAAEPAVTTISVEGMHCAGCASKVTRRLQAVTGVAVAKTDAPSSTAWTTAKGGAVLSPKALWEAVEQAGYKPLKLVGPSGTFTTKPKT